MQRKKKIKGVLLVSIFVLSIILTNIQFFPNIVDTNQNNIINNPEEGLSTSSDGYLSDYYLNGPGDAQDVRIFATNDSNSVNNEQYFEISSLSNTDTTYLSYGNFNFTFQNNYTTNYVLENTNALYAREFIQFNYDEDISSISVHTGSVYPGDSLDLNKMVDGQDSSYIRFQASNGIINFSLAADFTGTHFSRSSPNIQLNFNRIFILGLINTFRLRPQTADTYLTIKAFDISDSTWKNVTKPILIKASSIFQNYDDRIINENLDFIDLSNIAQIQFYFRNFSVNNYIVRFAELNIAATYGFDLPITNNNYVALEFDLKGEKSTVNGFYTWIRTLDVGLAATTTLNISLYEANATITRTQSNLRTNNLEPNYNKMIDSILISNYIGDNVTYFEFNQINTVNMKLYNYFIVIKSNRPENVYSLVTIPRFTFGDPDNRVDHQLRTTSDNGQNWEVARKIVPSTLPYLSERLDASPFKINVTRGYMPSDFWKSENDNLNIQDIPIEDYVDSSAPYEDSSYLTWGIGQWNNIFTTPISAIPPNDFQVDLNWNITVAKGFKFNVSYSVKAYWIEATITTYNVTYDALPEWTLSFDLVLADPNFDDWNFLEFWFVYPSSYDAHNLTNPNNDELLFKTEGEEKDIYKAAYDIIVVNKTLVAGISGIYIIETTSPNLIYQTHSFINYAGTFWETNGFMFGDDMTASVDIRDQNGNAPKNGQANVKLFYPEIPGGQYPSGERNDLTGVKEDSLFRYDFNNDTLLQIRNTLSYFGIYYLGFFWINGSAIGCKKLPIYIDSYDVEMDDCFYDSTLDVNILSGTVDKVFQRYSLLIGTVNVTENFDYPVQNYDINKQYLFDMGNVKIPIVMNYFLQNETVLNPDEGINVKVSLQNMFELSDVKVKVKAQLVSLANEKWIIDEVISSYQTLKLKGDPLGRDKQEYSLDFTIPHLQSDGIWQGVNAPVRKGGVKTKLTFFIKVLNEDVEFGTYRSKYNALLVNSSQNDFEGYLIELKHIKDKTAPNILIPFARDECIYLPDQTTFVVNIYDKNYVSSYNDFIASFELKRNSIFSNITIDPETPIRGQKFNLSAILTTDLGEIIPFKNVTLQYYDEDAWANISSQISNIKGKIEFEIDTLNLNAEDQFLFRLTWQGDFNTMAKSQNVTVDIYRELNNLKIVIKQNTDQIYKNGKTTVRVIIRNTGTSQLYIPASNISIITQPNLASRIVEINYIQLDQLLSGESTMFIIELDVLAVNKIVVNISIDAYNVITAEAINFQGSATFKVFDQPLAVYIITFLTVIIVGLIALFWLVMYAFVRRLRKRIETPIEDLAKKKPRRKKYVKVSEIKKVPEKEKAEPTKTDLDSLLKEEGLEKEKTK